MPRWSKSHLRSPPRRDEELVSTDEPAAEDPKSIRSDESPIPTMVTTAADERIDTPSQAPKKRRRNRGPLRLFRGGDATRSHASSAPKSESPSKELKPHYRKKHKGLSLFHRRNKPKQVRNKSSSTQVEAQTTTSKEVAHADQNDAQLATNTLIALSQTPSEDVDRPFYNDVCALPTSLCCGVENAINCLGFPCFVVQQVMNDFAALLLGEEIQADYKPTECTDDDQTLEDDAMTVKLEDDEEEVKKVDHALDDKIVRNESESTTVGSDQDDEDSIEGKQSVDDETTTEEESINEDSFSKDDSSIEGDSLEDDASVEDLGVRQYDEERQVSQNPSIEEFVHEFPAMKQDWPFQDSTPENEVYGMTKQEEEKSFQEEVSLLENEEWSFLPEYAASTQELEQALEEKVEPEEDNKDNDDQNDQHVENKFEVFFNRDEWRRDLATKEQVREEDVSAVPSYELREDAPENEPEEEENGEDHVMESFEKPPTFQPTMLVNPNQNKDHQNEDVLEDPLVFVEDVQCL